MPKHLVPNGPYQRKTIRTKRWLKRHQGSSTAGKTKVVRCQAKPEHRVVCSRNRSYKQRNYATVMAALDRKRAA